MGAPGRQAQHPVAAGPGPDLEAVPPLRRRVPSPAGAAPARGLGAAAAVLGVLLAGLSLPGPVALTAGVVALQLLLVLTLLVVLDTPGRTGAVLVALGAAAVADALVLRADGDVDSLAGVAALALVAALLHQLARREARTRVTMSLACTLLAVVVVAAAACLIAVRDSPGGRDAALVALLAAALALPAVRLLTMPDGPARSARGLLLALLAGLVVGGVVGLAGDDLVPWRAALLGSACALAVALVDRLTATAELPGGAAGRRRRAALRPVSVLLPYALLGPVALVGARLALG